MKKRFAVLLCLFLLFTGCTGTVEPVNSGTPAPSVSDSIPVESIVPQEMPSAVPEESEEPDEPALPLVYMTTDISPEGLLAVYEALGQPVSGNVAVKISTGEEGSYYLRPALIGDFVQAVGGTIVESNTAYSSRRASTAMHLQLAADRGYTAIAPVAILDADGSLSLPVENGVHLTENLVGRDLRTTTASLSFPTSRDTTWAALAARSKICPSASLRRRASA